MVKEVVDRFVALLLLLILLPLLLVTALAVRCTSPGPAFFASERIGRNGERFFMWKFRTMRTNAHSELQSLLEKHGRDGAPLFKVPDDPRITRLGRWLRRTSVDELPQLINVLVGHMSLVGPRPQMPGEVALYSGRDWQRLSVKPGITGLWQISGRSSLAWSDAIEYDLTYVREWSLVLDARILVRTLGAVLRGDGAE